MSKLKVRDKVYVEGVVVDTDVDGYLTELEIQSEKDCLQYIIAPTCIIHKALPSTLCGNWVNYKGEKWWCVGLNGKGEYILCQAELSFYCHSVSGVRVSKNNISLWQKPKTITVNGVDYVEVV